MHLKAVIRSSQRNVTLSGVYALFASNAVKRTALISSSAKGCILLNAYRNARSCYSPIPVAS
jgi:hypothetical protein